MSRIVRALILATQSPGGPQEAVADGTRPEPVSEVLSDLEWQVDRAKPGTVIVVTLYVTEDVE